MLEPGSFWRDNSAEMGIFRRRAEPFCVNVPLERKSTRESTPLILMAASMRTGDTEKAGFRSPGIAWDDDKTPDSNL